MKTQSQKQRDVLMRLSDEEDEIEAGPVSVKEGYRVDFVDEPEHSGVVSRLTSDQWHSVFIDYGVPGQSFHILYSKLDQLIKTKKAIVTSPSDKS